MSEVNVNSALIDPLNGTDNLYYGDANTGEVIVVQGSIAAALDPRIDICRYSDDFSWGHPGASTLQLALALMTNALGSDRRAAALHEQFASNVLEKFDPDDNWLLSRTFIESEAVEIEAGLELNHSALEGVPLEEAIR